MTNIATGGQHNIGIHKASGQYTKKIKGSDGKWTVKYLGKAGGKAALRAAEKKWRELVAEEQAKAEQTPGEKLSIGEAIDAFLIAKRGEGMHPNSMHEYERLCKVVYNATKDFPIPVVKFEPRHFQAIERAIKEGHPDYANGGEYAPTTLQTKYVMVRAIFTFVRDNYTRMQPWYGTYLEKPPKRDLRLHKQRQIDKYGEGYFEPEEIRAMLDLKSLTPRFRAAILLGINAGLYEADMQVLEPQHITGEVLSNTRHKTGQYRRAILWPETVAALEALQESEQKWFPASRAFLAGYFTEQVQKPAGVYRERRAHKHLRHTFLTNAEPIDPEAARITMGWVAPDEIADAYRKGVSDDRLRKVSDGVRRWLFGD